MRVCVLACRIHALTTPHTDALRAYLKQAREEVGLRLLPLCYTPDGQPNKFWMAFSRRKFMNTAL